MLTTYGMGVGGLSVGGYGVSSDNQNNIVELIGIGTLMSETMKIASRYVSFFALGSLTAQASIVSGGHTNNSDPLWQAGRRRRRRRQAQAASRKR